MNQKLKARIQRRLRRSRKLLALARHQRGSEDHRTTPLPGPPRCLEEKLRQPEAEAAQ